MTKIASLTSRRALVLAIVATATGAVAAPSAWADAPLTLCVHQTTACPSGATDEGSNLQAALDAAAARPASSDSPNVIDIESGTYTTPAGASFLYRSANPLRIIGAGSDSTTITAADTDLDTFIVGSSSAARTISISGLTITNVTPDAYVLALTGGTADHLVVATTQSGGAGVALTGSTLSDSTVYAQSSYAGVIGTADSTPGSSIELDDDTINGGTDAVQTSVPAAIHRSTLIGQAGLYVDGVAASIDDSLVEAQQGITSLALGNPASIQAVNDTLVGTQGATQGVRASGYGGAASDVQIENSIVYAFPYSFQIYDDGPSDHATIEASTDNYNGMSLGSGITRGAPIGDDPGFVAPLQGNYHLGSWSGLIDAAPTSSLSSGASTTDRDGNPRAVTVDNAATPVDLGAYEYQPPAATPGGGNPGSGGNPSPGSGPNPSPGTGQNPGPGTPGTGTPSNGSRPLSPPHHARIVKLTQLGHPAVSGRRISLRLSCSGTAACTPVNVTATAMRRHHRVTVGSLRTQLSAGHRAALTLVLNRAGRALLASTGNLTVTLKVTVRNGARTVTVETAHVKLT